MGVRVFFFFFKQKTAYEIGTGDWSSDVCSSDLTGFLEPFVFFVLFCIVLIFLHLLWINVRCQRLSLGSVKLLLCDLAILKLLSKLSLRLLLLFVFFVTPERALHKITQHYK